MKHQLIRRLTLMSVVMVLLAALFFDVSIVRNATVKLFPHLQEVYAKNDSVVRLLSNTTTFATTMTNISPTGPNAKKMTRLVPNRNNETGGRDGGKEKFDRNKTELLKKSRNSTTTFGERNDHEQQQESPQYYNTIPTNHSYDRPTTILVKLSGEMGNCLSKFATARGLQFWAKDKYGIETEFVVRHQDASKWVGAMKNIQRCFPKLRGYNFSKGNTPEYQMMKKRQRKWLGNLSALLLIETAHDEDDIEETLSTLKTVLHWKNSTYHNDDQDDNNNMDKESNMTLPYLKADYLAMIDFWIDKYYDEYRNYFKFDRRACCKQKPDADESVFHFRNFLTEMPKRGKRLGFEELSANRTAYELFRNLKAGDKVAITSRFSTDPSMQPYIDAFKERDIQVRVVDKQSPVEDFCFLMHAKKELVGNAESSFVLWAGYLGNPNKVRLYSMDSPDRRSSLFAARIFKHYNWTNPKLKDKVFFELYDA